MQDKLARGAAVALGVEPSTSPDHVRAAFLGLTKTFHPARFGRMSPEIQKLSNDVFVALKHAYEVLARPANTNAATGVPQPVAPATTQKIQPPPPRSVTQALGSRATPANGVPQRAADGPTQRGFAVPPSPPSAPAGDAITQRGYPPTAANPEEQRLLQQALALIAAQDWPGAHKATTKLVAHAATKAYRALLCYSRGREAAAAGKRTDAVADLQRALQFDPDLGDAKSALADLMQGA